MAVWRFLITLTTIVAASAVLSRAVKKGGQPPVIGEVLGGIVLGPSLMGWAAPKVSAFIFPPGMEPLLSAVSQLGVILYMFVVGMELDLRRLRPRLKTAVAVSNLSIIVP